MTVYNKICKHCNEDFKTTSANRAYCSSECRSVGYRNVVFQYDKNIEEFFFKS